jgi:hypothetical protein
LRSRQAGRQEGKQYTAVRNTSRQKGRQDDRHTPPILRRQTGWVKEELLRSRQAGRQEGRQYIYIYICTAVRNVSRQMGRQDDRQAPMS